MDCPVSRRRAEAVTDLLALEKADGVAVLTLSRPDQLNAYTVAMTDQLIAALDDLDADDEVRAVVVTGAGRTFCAGMDLSGSDPFDAGDDAARRRDSGGELALRLFASTKPLIAAINGAAGRRRRHDDAPDGHPAGQ